MKKLFLVLILLSMALPVSAFQLPAQRLDLKKGVVKSFKLRNAYANPVDVRITASDDVAVRIFPRMLRIEPGATQVVRFRASAAGKGRLTFQTQQDRSEAGQGMSAEFTIGIPLEIAE